MMACVDSPRAPLDHRYYTVQSVCTIGVTIGVRAGRKLACGARVRVIEQRDPSSAIVRGGGRVPAWQREPRKPRANSEQTLWRSRPTSQAWKNRARHETRRRRAWPGGV